MSQNLSRKMRRAQGKREKQSPLQFTPATKVGQGVSAAEAAIPISVTMIVRKESDYLRRTLESLRPLLRPCDEILIVHTGQSTDQVSRDFGARVISRPDLSKDFRPFIEKWLPEFKDAFEKTGLVNGCLLDFAAARQVAMDEAKHDIQFWLDDDDIFAEKTPGQTRSLIEEIFRSGRADAFFLEYKYATDVQDGQVTTTLKRERVVDRRVYHWVGRCHETCIPRDGIRPRGAAFFADLDAAIVHVKDRSPFPNPSDLRNYVIIRKEIEESGDRPDPRSVFYLGNAARGLQRDAEAIDLYKRFLPMSGSRDDRFAAAYYTAVIYMGEKVRRPLDAMDALFTCIALKPEDPRGPFGLARSYFQLGRYHESLHWFRVGKLLPEPTMGLHSYDPTHVRVLPLQLAALCFEKLGDEANAIQCVEELTRLRPNHKETQELQKYVANWIAGRQLVESVRRVLANSADRTAHGHIKAGQALVSLLPQVPPELEDMGLAKPEPADNRPGKDLVIFCGRAPEPWGPRSGETGIGGSEKAVIQMAPRLQRRGFRVTVYANVPADQRGVDPDTGVRWEHFGAFDKSRSRGTMIYWRIPEMLELPFACERRVLWCHDVQDQRRWNPARVALADQVWVLSKYHATTLGPVADQLGKKLVVTRNGIDAELYKRYFEKVERNPKKVIFASSPDRGALTAIREFQRTTAPGSNLTDAELHIFYGFTKMYLDHAAQCEYRHVPDVNRDCSAYDYMKAVLQAVDQDDRIKWRGRIGWEDLAKEMCSAGVWIYPTQFPEISCMAAMEAQAAGCIPVSSRCAALAETVFTDPATLREALETPVDSAARGLIHHEACRRFSYETLADEWRTLLG